MRTSAGMSAVIEGLIVTLEASSAASLAALISSAWFFVSFLLTGMTCVAHDGEVSQQAQNRGERGGGFTNPVLRRLKHTDALYLCCGGYHRYPIASGDTKQQQDREKNDTPAQKTETRKCYTAVCTRSFLVSPGFHHLLHGVHHDALGLVEQGQPRGNDGLLEQPAVLGRSMVVDAVDQLAAEESAQPAQQPVNKACRADGTAVWAKRCCSGGGGAPCVTILQ